MDQKVSSSKDKYTVNIPSTNREKIKPQEVDAPLPIDSTKVKNPFIIPGLQKIKIDSQLNVNYNFGNFIEGESNRLARSAGKAVAKRPGGTAFNPLFIYGGVGLGKTHLAHAIGLEAKEYHPDKTVLYVSTDKFVQQFTDAARNNNRNDFIHFCRVIHTIIVRCMHFFYSTNTTQDDLFDRFHIKYIKET